MYNDDSEYNIKTQRFLINRWETPTGEEVRQEIIEGIKNCVEIRCILDRYILNHQDNSDPYRYPFYPEEEFGEDRFWVLTQDDLRGIVFNGEEFSNCRSLEKKRLSYARFHGCNLNNANLEGTKLSFTVFENCMLGNVNLAGSGGHNSCFINCSMKCSCLWESYLEKCDFSGTDLTGSYCEGIFLNDIKVNHLTKLDVCPRKKWGTREMPGEQVPDMLRAFRIAYEKAEIWSKMDLYLRVEKRAERKYLLWKAFREKVRLNTFMTWFISLLKSVFSGYSTSPMKIISSAVMVSLFFAIIFIFLGTPNNPPDLLSSINESIYFSLTTFATLGYGDISYSEARPYMRILSAVEAWVGVVYISLFVVVLARKIFR